MNNARAALIGLSALLAACASASAPAPAPSTPVAASVDLAAVSQLHVAPASPTEFTAFCDAAIAHATTLRTALETDRGAASVARVFVPFDALYGVLSDASNEAGLVSETNPNPEIRTAAETCIERTSAIFTELSLSRPLYDRLAAIDATSADTDTRFALTNALEDYRRAGVDRDEATRARVLELENATTETSLAFARNIRDDVDEVTFASAEALNGLPADYIANHAPGADGLIRINTQSTDVTPVLSYATNAATRREVYMAYRNRAYPQNEAMLRQLLDQRYQLARILGRDNYATLITEDKMIGSPANAQRFLDELAGYARPAAQRDYARQLRRLRREDRTANSVPQWTAPYVQQLIAREEYALDAQEVRGYFAYNNVRDGIFGLVQDLFGVEIRPWTGAPVWHDSVEAFEMYDNGQLIGRFFLDMHPRDGKFNHAAQFPLRYGAAGGRAIPIGALVCNFPAGGHDTGLMEHAQVETFLHEFGHLIHSMFAGHQQYAQLNYGSGEYDFIEAPSSLLEEWIWDYDTLATFAVNAQGQPIPRELVQRMNEARVFGQAQATLTQLSYAAVSLNFYNRNPANIDLEALYADLYGRYAVFPLAQGTHHYAQFGHLTDYSAIVYTYEWSQSIALDLFTQFETHGLRDTATAQRYRDLVLAPGGSKPAATLIQDFLGRPNNLEAYRRRLQQ